MKNIILKIAVVLIIVTNSYLSFGQNISFISNELYPEGVAYSSKQKTFFLSSLHYGKIGKLSPLGIYTDFIDDPELVSSLGMLADEKRNQLYVCVSDPGVSTRTNKATQGKLAKLLIFDLTNGKKIMSVDLGILNATGGNFANDVTMDNEGNLYVTNSFSPIIFKITQGGQASIFATNDAWKGEGFNLNGIVFHSSGFLLVSQSNTGYLYKVSISNPTQISKIKTEEIIGADGLVINGKNELVLISNSKQTATKFSSSDNWESATVLENKKMEKPFPTTGVRVNGNYYILNAKLGELFDPNAKKTSDFALQIIN